MEKIQPYPLPTERQLPKSIADWQPNSSRAALLIHDMQRYFLDFYTADASPIAQVIDNIYRLLSVARRLHVPVFYTAQPGDMTPQQRGLLHSLWGSGMNGSQEHKQIVPPLTPLENEWVLTKWRYSAFFNSPLLSTLHELKCDQLIVCGVYAHIGFCAQRKRRTPMISRHFLLPMR